MKKHNAALYLVPAVSAALVLSACTSPPPVPDGSGGSGGSKYTLSTSTPPATKAVDLVTWGTMPEPASLDYSVSFSYTANQVIAGTCESLMRQNSDLSVSPGLAESVDRPDDLTLVYKLREGVTFNDGTSLTADDAVASMTRNWKPAVYSAWSGIYTHVSSIEATGPLEVTVRFSQPDSGFNLSMSTAAGVVESAATLAAAGDQYGTAGFGVNCTGPFKFESWKTGEEIRFSKNENYWDEELQPFASEFVFKIFSDRNTLAAAAQSGEIDGAWQLPSASFDQLLAATNGELYLGEETAVIDQVVANFDGVLKDKRVRQALLMATDREGLVASAEHGAGLQVDSPVPPFAWSNESVRGLVEPELTHYAYDVDAAKALIEEAGAVGEPLVIATANFDTAWNVNAKEVAAAATRIGLSPTIETLPPVDYLKMFGDAGARSQVDLFMTQWAAPNGDPSGLLQELTSGSAANYGGWENADYDAAVEAAQAAFDPAERAGHLAEAQRIFNEELPWLPMYSPLMSLWLSDGFSGPAPLPYFQWFPWTAQVGGTE